MKENLKKIKIFILINLICLSLGCSAQVSQDEIFYKYLENLITEKKYAFFELSLIKRCNNKYLFGISKMNYNDNLSSKLKVYTYKNTLIVYDFDKENDKQVINFFDKYFEVTDIDISKIVKGNQSVIDTRILYFNDGHFIQDIDKGKKFLEKDCK